MNLVTLSHPKCFKNFQSFTIFDQPQFRTMKQHLGYKVSEWQAWWVLEISNQFSTCLLLDSFFLWVDNQASQDLFCLGDLPHEFPEKLCFWYYKIFLKRQIHSLGTKSVTFNEYFEFIPLLKHQKHQQGS